MDAELPFAFEPHPETGAAPPAPAPPRDPPWTGLQTVIVILFTIVAILLISVAAFLMWALTWRATGAGIYPHRMFVLVAISLIGQAGGMAAGVGFFAFLLAGAPGTRFWQAVQWRRLPGARVASFVLGGMALMVAVQLLGHVLPVPNQVPMDRLFTPRTAWLLVVYGVGMAPFFEEFFFRGLIYPSLRSTFDLGFQAEEQQAWKPLIRGLASLGLLGAGLWYWRDTLLGPDAHGGLIGLGIAIAALLLAVALPGAYLSALGWLANRMAEWRQPELLAILLTGFLFGMMHAAQLGWSWAAVLLLVVVGVILTWVRASSGSLMASWLVHCAYNGTLFFVEYFATQGFRHFGPGAR